MFRSFRDKETKLIYNQERSKKLPAGIQERALIKLMLIDAAEKVSDLQAPPSNRLEKLKGLKDNHWSIRINDKWRILLQFENGNAYLDYLLFTDHTPADEITLYTKFLCGQ